VLVCSDVLEGHLKYTSASTLDTFSHPEGGESAFPRNIRNKPLLHFKPPIKWPPPRKVKKKIIGHFTNHFRDRGLIYYSLLPSTGVKNSIQEL
jgi:hypothetical protein